jgi:methylmalonyl-CoA mutase N-terminal domain/subunit
MYRGRLWTMRQFAGFGTAEETNERFRYLLDHGQTGLSTAFDMPSLMGHDSDHPRSLGEVGREGVAIDTVDDMQTLFGGIDLGKVSVSMTINAPAAIMMAFYVAAADRSGVPADRLGGTIQADILKEYIAQKEWCFPVDPAMRLLGDLVEWSTYNTPRWHPVSISGYHIREAGSTWTTSPRGSRSSSTRTSTSSRRSPSTAPRAASGRASCARPTGRRARARG